MFRLTPVVKNLLIANVVVFALEVVLGMTSGIDLNHFLSLYPVTSDFFSPFQFATHMFAHANLMHIFMNMFMLAMLGVSLEYTWGGKRFLKFYLIVGLGAGLLYSTIGYFNVLPLKNKLEAYQSDPSPTRFAEILYKYDKKIIPEFRKRGLPYDYYEFLEAYENSPEQYEPASKIKISNLEKVMITYQGGMLGASGAVFGVLMAFGMLFPEQRMMLLFPPIPIKAKYLVFGMGALALIWSVKNNPDDNVAHLAHLSGMIISYIVIRFRLI